MSTEKVNHLIEVSRQFDAITESLMNGDLTPHAAGVAIKGLSGKRLLHADALKYTIARGEKPELDFYECK